MPTAHAETSYADILALVDRLAALESALRQSAAFYAEHADEDPHVKRVAVEKAAKANDVMHAIALLERLAHIAKIVQGDGGGLSRRRLRTIIDKAR